jgi:agmatine deiminase
MPGEWAPHERTVVCWPARASLWGAQLERAKITYAMTVRAIAAYEPVTLVTRPTTSADAMRVLEGLGRTGWLPELTLVEIPIDDSWVRDSGPIVVTGDGGRRAAIDFGFNGWGEKFTPYADDDALPERLSDVLGLSTYRAPLVLEGGSITVDGAGTLVTTEQCLLHPSRNPDLTRADIERLLIEWLGVERVVWLAAGLVEDAHTDGHVDNVCAFVAPNRALVQTTTDRDNPNHAILEDNRARLDAAGIETLAVDVLPYDDVGGQTVVVPPLNCSLVNGAVIVPIPDGDARVASAATAAIADHLPDRDVATVPASVLAYGGGGVHCITQQVPA